MSHLLIKIDVTLQLFGNLKRNFMMNWQNYITAVPLICEGRACFKNTPIMVSKVLENLADGVMPNDIQKKYPALNQEAIQAALVFATQIAREQIFNLSKLASHREVRVAGRLEAIKLNDYTFSMAVAESLYPINGFAKAVEPQTLSTLLGKNVVVSGTAHFTKEGALLVLEAAQIEIAKERDLMIWGQVPKPFLRPFDMSDFKVERGLSAIIGKLSGDETDKEVLQVLEELS
ncbi:MAG: hypothetical protein DRQ49_17460 [Gammaproteobacteria bacterium]|nr:MAG: hypothetical protein DRQ49_17460 [Gammaproteobacteria bacterium]